MVKTRNPRYDGSTNRNMLSKILQAAALTATHIAMIRLRVALSVLPKGLHTLLQSLHPVWARGLEAPRGGDEGLA